MLAAIDATYTRRGRIVGGMNTLLRRQALAATIMLTCAIAGAIAPAAAAELSFEEGVARDPVGGVLYREQHWVRHRDGVPLERLTLYRCADGTAFARKQVDYRRSRLAPEFELMDARSGYREGLRRSGGGPTLFVRERAGAQESARALAPQALVADAGFDEFIRRHWLTLVAGQRLPIEFAVPSRLRSLGFTVQRTGAVSTIAGEPALTFRLALGGILRWIAPHIEVSYGQKSRRLLRFEGLGNLRDDRSAGQLVARIDFASPPRAVTEGDRRPAADTPLSACSTGRRTDGRIPARTGVEIAASD